MPPTDNNCPLAQVNKARIDGVEGNMDRVWGSLESIEQEIKTALKRPGWATVVIITILSGACSALAVGLIAKLNGG